MLLKPKLVYRSRELPWSVGLIHHVRISLTAVAQEVWALNLGGVIFCIFQFFKFVKTEDSDTFERNAHLMVGYCVSLLK